MELHLIFDLFGTLVETPDSREVIGLLEEIEEHCSAPKGLYQRWVETSIERDSGQYESSDIYWRSLGVKDTREATLLYSRTNSYWLDKIRVGALEFLDEVNSLGITSSLCSNAGFETISLLRSSDLYKRFNKVVISAEVKSLKPDLKMYQYALDWDKKYDKIIFIGDGGSNELEGASKFGAIPIQICELKSGGIVEMRKLQGEHERVNSFADLKGIIYREMERG